MTREELKEHCKKTVEQCEMWAIHRGEEPSGKVYEEHKLILSILEQEPCKDAVIAEINKQYKWLMQTKHTLHDIDISFDAIKRIASVQSKAKA